MKRNKISADILFICDHLHLLICANLCNEERKRRMVAKAIVKFLRISPTKLRQVIDLIRGKEVSYAKSLLSTVNKQSKTHILKLLNSAIANAKQKGINPESLYISKITADAGPMWKRYRAAAFGRATKILRRTSHLKIELDLKTN